MPNLETLSCPILLKEWAVTCAALAQNRQLILLRKGGLLDENGLFQLEHREFFLLPTWLHQDVALVKPEHRDLFELAQKAPEESAKRAIIRHFARVERVWMLEESAQGKLENVPQIWTKNYLDLRFAGYKPEKPVLCAALRIWELETPFVYDLRPEDLGCRSWIEMEKATEAQIRAVEDGAAFARRLRELKNGLEFEQTQT